MNYTLNNCFYIIVFFVSSFTLNAQTVDFEVIFETISDESPSGFKLNGEDGFIGFIHKAPPTDSVYVHETYLYTVGQNGDTMGVKFEKEDTIINFYDIYKLNSQPKGFLLTGSGYKKGGDKHHPFIVFKRLNDELVTVWEKYYFFDNYYFGVVRTSAMELINGDLLYACSPNLNSDMFLLKLTDQGDSLDFKAYTGSESGEIWGLTYNPDSSTILLHTKWAHYVGGGYVCSALSLDSNLFQTNVNYYPEDFMPPFNSLSYPNNLLLTGGRDELYDPYTGEDAQLICAYLLDTAFNIKREVHLTHPDTLSRAAEFHGIDYYYPSCIYLGGNHNLQGMTGQQPSWIYITKLNDTLGVEYEKYIGGDYYYWLYSVIASSDGGVLLTGTRQEIAPTYFQRDAFLIKLDSVGCITQGPDELQSIISDAIIYPNPGSDFIKIRTALKYCNFILFDMWGREIIHEQISNSQTTINTNSLDAGNYYYSIVDKNKLVISGIWVKQ